jgi:outer membrane receptor protein involved in Fe transport
MKSLRILMWSASAIALTAAGAVRAQTAAPSSGAAAQNATTIAEVTVTAEKRQERLIDTPVAASALNYRQLQTYADTDLESIGSQLPQVQLVETGGSSAGAALSIRGVGNLAVDYGTEEPVALVIDGMQLTRGHAIDMGAFDIGQVEVLEGPQALFFGKNSPAGVVALSTVSPGRTYEGYVRAGYEVARCRWAIRCRCAWRCATATCWAAMCATSPSRSPILSPPRRPSRCPAPRPPSGRPTRR